ncbi:hypothetical protein BCV70DRAFT_198681 [Testicularia cyperi]|uniref:Uncharacterized protein n=1 Tax=Testicularia cyperi TaxID=1882483 RepID=A0A317XVR1_9BASI|nr:hypothetical protein BCV70DRAFT_198681 [Testicularia cyperi]
MSAAGSGAGGGGVGGKEDKYAKGMAHKTAGNTAFGQGDLAAALREYHFAVLYLKAIDTRSILGLMGENEGRDGHPDDLSSVSSSDPDPEPDEQDGDGDGDGEPTPQSASAGDRARRKAEKQLSLVHSNMSLIYLRQTKYTRAIEAAEAALKADSSNTKAKFRKAQALRLDAQLYAARQFLESVLTGTGAKRISQEDKKSLQSELDRTIALIEAKQSRERAKWKGFLGKKPDSSNSKSKSAES